MTDEPSLLAAVIAHRLEDTPRLMYADYCLDSDDPVLRERSEFVRLSVELVALPRCDLPCPVGGRMCRLCYARSALRVRTTAMARRPAIHSWLDGFTARVQGASADVIPCNEWRADRGFVGTIHVPFRRWLRTARAWYELTPITEVRFDTWPSVAYETHPSRVKIPCTHVDLPWVLTTDLGYPPGSLRYGYGVVSADASKRLCGHYWPGVSFGVKDR